MLFSDQVKPFISSPNHELRFHALRYFAESHQPDSDVIPLFLKSWEYDL